MAMFQVALAGEWKNYSKNEDMILKRSYMAGYPNCRFTLRGASYEYNFDRMVQMNLTTGKERKIRAPHSWKQPAKPIVPKGPTLCMNVPAGSPGKTIQINHPKVKGATMQVAVPKHAKVGQAMLVPIQDVAVASNVSVVTAGVVSEDIGVSNADCNSEVEVVDIGVCNADGNAQAVVPVATCMNNNSELPAAPLTGNGTNVKGGWSTRAKVAAGGAAVAALGGGAFAAALAITAATEETGDAPPPPGADYGWEWSPPSYDGTAWCPGATDTFEGIPIAGEGAGEDAGGDIFEGIPIAGEGAGEDAGGGDMCGDAGGAGSDAADDVGIVDPDDDAEWLAEMCGYQDEFTGDGGEAVADAVVDLF